MNVTVNEKVKVWMQNQTQASKDMFNTKCTEAVQGDFSTWRNVGRRIYDYRASGNFRVVAIKNSDGFSVAAIYKHSTSGGKELVCGQRLNY